MAKAGSQTSPERGKEVKAMSIKELTPDQVRTMSLAEKDRWWLKNVWRGDMPQLTVRSAVTGMLLGSVLSLTNLYIASKTGWSLGVGITSVILAFAIFRLMSGFGIGKGLTLLENNAMQSIATASGYMAAPFVSSLTAYMVITDAVIPIWMACVWVVFVGILGVLYAFPLKRRFINDEQAPFPEGLACGYVMDALHETERAAEGMKKASILTWTAVFSAVFKVFQNGAIMEKLKLGFMSIPENIGIPLKIKGIALKDLTTNFGLDIVMVAAGGLVGIQVAVSMLLGGAALFLIIVPIMASNGEIAIVAGAGENWPHIRDWSLWCGVAMMVTASVFGFFARPKQLLSAFSRLLGKKTASQDADIEAAMKKIELPMWVFVVGIPTVGIIIMVLANIFFGVPPWISLLAILLTGVFVLIAVNSTALTGITPVTAMGQLTQLTFSAIAPGQIVTNVMCAGITGEAASHASNLLMDIKPGYMLGGKPRHQAIGHVLGIIAGAVASSIAFYAIFTGKGPQGIMSEQYPMPNAAAWKAVADVLTGGFENIPISARWGALYGGLIGVGFSALRHFTKGKFWLNAFGIGLAIIIPYEISIEMFIGAMIVYLYKRASAKKVSGGDTFASETNTGIIICAGITAGGAIMGLLLTLVETFL